MNWETFKELTAFAVVLGSFVVGLFVGLPKAFRYYEKRLQDISAENAAEMKALTAEYRRREEEQEARHRAEVRALFQEAAKSREEDNKRFCDALSEITNQLKSLEKRLDHIAPN